MRANRNDLVRALAATSQIYGRQMDQAAAELLVSDLSEYPVEEVLKALTRCRKELRHFPTVADILDRIPDGHPGPEEAWAMLPRSEADTVVWTEEIAEAFQVCSPLLERDEVAARMAFKEKYTEILANARAIRKLPRWTPSLGNDSGQREMAIQAAVAQGRITEEHAKALLPHRAQATRSPQLTGPTEDPGLKAPEQYAHEILERIKQRGSDETA